MKRFMTSLLASGAAAAALVALPAPSAAHVTRFVVNDHALVAGGMNWGKAGPYERLRGTAYMEVDPVDPLNAVIFNIDKAPRNSRGMVEFSTPFVMLKPVDMNRSNHKLWVGLNNRGNCIEVSFGRAFPTPAGGGGNCNRLSAEEIGPDNPLLQKGFVIVDAGWQGDGIPDPDREQLYPNFPVAVNPDGSPITGPLRLEYQLDAATYTQPLPQPFAGQWRAYPAADLNTANATLTVRDRADAPKVSIAANRWAFGRCAAGRPSLVQTATDICLFDGFAPNKIYELIYTARDPIVMGLAYAVPRDIGSFLRYSMTDQAGNRNPLATGRPGSGTGIVRAYSSGTSSTGMYQREFLYLGFNEDEARRKVFDGVTIYSAASYRLFANVQFAHPTFFSGQDQHQDYTSNAIVPFTFAVTTDPVTGVTDGLLKRPATDPLVMQIDEELVFWQWKASLNVVNSAGTPVPVPDKVRLYFQNGFGHIGASGLLAPAGPAGICRHNSQGIASVGMTPRALVQVMDDWADRGIPPPPSNYPTKADLVTVQQYQSLFPTIPGMEAPTVMNQVNVLDFGPLFGPTGGNRTVLPPRLGPQYQALVPKPRPGDGAGAAGIHTMYTRAPLGTNVGWNIRAARAPNLCGLAGSYRPFARTRAERLAAGDSRPSLEERYGSHAGFVNAVRRAGKELVRERFLMKQDADKFIRAAEESNVLK
ncbi:alpha/beta hydrolase domain-containing protein [Massilia niabensis]|uniref:Alpha/beta hydrolase domain-containing protein n=1 Tax=Massilia niabensis TaxID=544910 RepID=A0ABW0LA30_9BURK